MNDGGAEAEPGAGDLSAELLSELDAPGLLETSEDELAILLSAGC